MDFLERIFNLWPDGGSGATEIAVVLTLVMVVVFWRTLKQLRRKAWLLPGSGPAKAAYRDAGEGDAKNH